MPELTYREAVRRAMVEEMRRDDRVFLMGEEVGHYQGAYKVSQGMLEEFGEDRVVDTPISENGFAGVGVGAAMCGLKPIIEFMTWNFSLVAIDQIINSAAKMLYMSGGQFNIPCVFRGPNGAGGLLGAQHSQALESYYVHCPGLIVLAPATPHDACGLLKTAIRGNNPVIFMESEVLYNTSGTVPDQEYTIPIGKADVKRQGSDFTIVTWSRALHYVLEALPLLEKAGFNPEIVDLRSLRPLDEASVYESVKKTNRVMIVEESWPQASMGSHLSDLIARHCFDYLDAPVARVHQADTPMPYAANLEKLSLPDAHKILQAAEELMA
ncbi:MAG: pyruvate dehydrogenase complex E1 component subunit beta [Spirochaetales bacterium]|nr:pyruvate dehydrogenase complex E1 component subunit beta [Spirochaetales bacterium]